MLNVKKQGNMSSVSLGWEDIIDKPVREKNFKEAFANADAMIDDEIEMLLREIYNNHKCQDLINEIHYLRGRVNFDGLVLAEILKSKTIIDENLLKKIRRFKKARNIVLHKLRGVHDLLTHEEFKDISDEDYEEKVIERATDWLEESKKIDGMLLDKIGEIRKKEKDYYFSREFYLQNPRWNEYKKTHPKAPMKKNEY